MTSANNRSLTQVQPNPSAVPPALRYYDPELQNASNAEPFDPERFQLACEKAKGLDAAYLRQLTHVADRVSKRTLGLLSDPRQPLFDADLFELSLGDALGYAASNRRRPRVNVVKMAFCSFDGSTMHLLTYRHIAAVSVHVPSERWFDSLSGRSRIDSLLANELTIVDERLMQHVFLFVSGTFISVRFERFNWDTKKNRQR